MPHVLNVWMYECCSEVDNTIAERVKNVIPRIFNWQMVGIKVKYEKFMAESEFSPEITVDYSGKRPVVDVHSQADLDIQGFEDFSTVSPTEILKKAGLITDASASHPTKKRRTVHFDSTTAEEQDVEGCSEDNATVSVDALIEFMVNHNSDNTNAGKSTTVHVHNDHMDVEGVSADIGSATLESLVAAVKNLKPDNTNVETSTMQIDYSSTLPESAQIELDAILKVITAPVNDVPIEVVPPSEPVVNQHDISDSQLPPDFSDAVVAAHQDTKFPAKRTKTRFKVFKSLYITEYTSGSKAIEDQIVEPKHKLSFDGFLISDNMPRGVIEEYKQWVEEELLKFHVKK
ncbi:hypothetical protein CQW23_10453 [Capsicum baccatum]|uniref:Uncharacterized protein n=1 Tax=Capsicum baccatum TaxID=33114 RepID=A0A2G2WZN7_CAPBA|nr:hypothetical protein CQW23_10453 [Capsicum baccatum]